MAPLDEDHVHEILRPEGWPRPAGYSDGIAATGRTIHVAGQIGWDPVTGALAGRDFAAQAARALENVVAVLHAGGASPAHVVRLTWYVTDLAAYRSARSETGAAFRRVFGGHYPVMSLVQVAGLLEQGAVVEIEATAIVGGHDHRGER